MVKGRVEVNYAPKILKIGFFDNENAPDNAEFGDYKEHYLLAEHEGKTVLTIESGPLEDKYLDGMKPQWDQALKSIKEISEKH